jgi:hypothetical protein
MPVGISISVREDPWSKPGLLETALIYPGLSLEMIADSMHLPPALVKLAYQSVGARRMCIISDATSGEGPPDGARFRMGQMDYEVADGIGMMFGRSAFALRKMDGGMLATLWHPPLRRKPAMLHKPYADLPVAFIDVGWGSGVAACRQAFLRSFLDLRLSPMRMQTCNLHEIAADMEKLLRSAGSLELAGICCINMEYGTPDNNLFAMYQVIEKFRQGGKE